MNLGRRGFPRTKCQADFQKVYIILPNVLYVYKSSYIYIYIYIYIYVCVCVCIHIYIYIYMYIHTFTQTFTMCMRVCVCVCMHVVRCRHVDIQMCLPDSSSRRICSPVMSNASAVSSCPGFTSVAEIRSTQNHALPGAGQNQ